MKKIMNLITLLLITTCIMTKVTAQNSADGTSKERLKMSGQVMLLSATNSTFTGGYFSLSPAARGQATASYRGFAFTAVRNSDLLDQASLANANILIPAYSSTFGAFTMTLATETYLFDRHHNFDMVAPTVTFLRKGKINVEAFVVYAFIMENENANIFSQRLAISKDYAGFTFKLTGWNVDWGTHRMAFSAEISAKINDHLRLTVMSNLNYNYATEITQKFGVVRLAYAF